MPARKSTTGSVPEEVTDLETLFGPSWRGFTMHSDRRIQVPGLRGWHSPQDLAGMWIERQKMGRLEIVAAQAERDIERMTEELHKAEARAEWYRRQLVLESRAGSMLAALMEALPPQQPGEKENA